MPELSNQCDTPDCPCRSVKVDIGELRASCHDPSRWKAVIRVVRRCFVLPSAIRWRVRSLLFRVNHGFWPEEWWNLDDAFFQWVLPRLCYFRLNTHGTPCGFEDDEWVKTLDEMIEGFQIASNWHYDGSQEHMEKVRRACKLFGKHVLSLWD